MPMQLLLCFERQQSTENQRVKSVQRRWRRFRQGVAVVHRFQQLTAHPRKPDLLQAAQVFSPSQFHDKRILQEVALPAIASSHPFRQQRGSGLTELGHHGLGDFIDCIQPEGQGISPRAAELADQPEFGVCDQPTFEIIFIRLAGCGLLKRNSRPKACTVTRWSCIGGLGHSASKVSPISWAVSFRKAPMSRRLTRRASALAKLGRSKFGRCGHYPPLATGSV